MNIAFFSDSYLPLVNGITSSLTLLNEQFGQMGHQVTVFAPQVTNGWRDTANVVRVKSIKIRENPPYYLTSLLSLYALNLVRQADFDVVHAHTPLSMGLLAYQAAYLLKRPLIYTYHTNVPEYLHYLGRLSKIKLVQKGAAQFDLMSCNLCNLIIAPSEKIKDILKTRGVSTPIEIVPNGIRWEKFVGNRQGYLRCQFGIKQTDKILLAVGRLGAEKNLPFLLKVLIELRRKFEGVKLVIAGSGYLLANLRQLTTEFGISSDVIFLGNVPFADMPALYADADVFVSASTTEVHPMAVLEAIASGLPVVAVNDKAFAETVIDGKNGFLTPVNETLFANKLLEILGNPALQLNMSCESQRIGQQFSIEKQASRLLTIYNTLTINKPKHLGHAKVVT